MRRTVLLVLTLVALAPASAARAQSLDHAGSVGLIAALGEGYATSEVARCAGCATERAFIGFGTLLDLGGSLAIGQRSSELILRLRLERVAPRPGESILLGYRQYFGSEWWKTFFGFDGQLLLRPIKTIGGRASLGLMHELSEVLGAYGEFGAGFGIGSGRRFGVELMLGLQARSYLLE